MTTVHIMSGIPGSGKSKIAKELDALRFNLDDIRAGMGYTTKESWADDKESVAIRTMIEGAKAAVKSGQNVCLDNTHLVPRLPAMYRKELGPLGVDWVVHDLTDVPIEECIRRDAEREKTVGEAVIRKMARRIGSWRLTEDWLREGQYEAPERYAPNPRLQSAFCADLDGTLALHDESDRGHFEYEKVIYDRPNQEVIDLVKSLAFGDNEYDVIFMSGREDRCRSDTQAWLDKYVGISSPLYMRRTGDHRPDYLVKTELFNKYVRDAYNVRFVIDDRQQVCELAWRAMGILCLQCAPGDF